MYFRSIVLRAVVLLVVAITATAATATIQRTFVSGGGNDANPCTLAQPCRGFAAALAKTSDKGEVIVLDSAGYGAVTIAQSVAIVAPPGVYAGVSVFSGDGININGAGIAVRLRGLTINGQAAGLGAGIRFVNGAQLLVEDCEVAGMDSGIEASAPGSIVNVKNSLLRNNINTGFFAHASLVATLEGISAVKNSIGVYASGAQVTVNNSVLTNNGEAGAGVIASNSTTELFIARSTLSGNANAFEAVAYTGGNASIVSDTNAISGNATVFKFLPLSGTTTIFTRGNNSVEYYTTLLDGGVLTSLGPI